MSQSDASAFLDFLAGHENKTRIYKRSVRFLLLTKLAIRNHKSAIRRISKKGFHEMGNREILNFTKLGITNLEYINILSKKMLMYSL